MNILEHITVNSDRKLREVSDQAYQRGFNKGRREGREESTHEFQKIIEEQERFHRKQLTDTLQQGRREGYTSRVQDEIAVPRLVPFWDSCCLLRDNETVELSGPGWHLDLTRDEARELAGSLQAEAEDTADPIDHDAATKAAIEEAM